MNRVKSSTGRSLQGYLLVGLAVVTCPCHLVIVVSLLSGTVAGAFLIEHVVTASLLLLLLFVYSSVGALRLLERGPVAAKCNPDRRSGDGHSPANREGTGCPD